MPWMCVRNWRGTLGMLGWQFTVPFAATPTGMRPLASRLLSLSSPAAAAGLAWECTPTLLAKMRALLCAACCGVPHRPNADRLWPWRLLTRLVSNKRLGAAPHVLVVSFWVLGAEPSFPCMPVQGEMACLLALVLELALVPSRVQWTMNRPRCWWQLVSRG